MHVNCKIAAFNLSALDTYNYGEEVEWQIAESNNKEYVHLAKVLNNDPDVSSVIIQHEYGIFGGKDGKKILSFMQNCQKPMLVTLHTAVPVPKPHMKDLTTKIISLAHTLVVLTQNSKEIIERVYPESVGKIFVIPHGIHPTPFSKTTESKANLEFENYTILSTFGLLNRKKGLEYVINALPDVIEKYPSILYLILGQTHPHARRKEGEKYRLELSRLVTKLGLEKHVKFYDQYLDLTDLIKFLKASDIYICTSTSPNQAVSGTLSYALGTGRAVVSTEFAHAKEMVTKDNGRLVPIHDSPAMTVALLDLLSDRKKLKQMHLMAYEKTRPMLWSNIAEQYTGLLDREIVII